MLGVIPACQGALGYFLAPLFNDFTHFHGGKTGVFLFAGFQHVRELEKKRSAFGKAGFTPDMERPMRFFYLAARISGAEALIFGYALPGGGVDAYGFFHGFFSLSPWP